MKNILRRIGLVTIFVSLATFASAQSKPEQRVQVLTLLGRPIQFVIADQQGFFSQHGIEVTNDNKKNSDELRTDLAAGKGDIAYLAVDNAVAMVELAHQDVVIVMGGEGSQNELLAQIEIKTLGDLRGKTLLVDAPNTAYALQMKKILMLGGMTAGKDYELKPFGATPQRLVALREHKEYAGSMLGPPVSLVAKHEGFVSLGSVQEMIGPYQAAGFFTQRAWAKEHREVLISFLTACIEAQRWLLAPANKQKVIDLLVSNFHLTPAIAAEDYEIVTGKAGGFAKDAQLDLRGFENVLKLRAEVEGQWNGQPPPVDKFYDPSYYNAAIKNVDRH